MMTDATGNLFELLRSRFPADLESPALTTPDGTCFTYADVDACTARYANVIRSLSVVPGDRVAVQTDKSPQALMLYLGCLRAGVVYLPMNVSYRSSEVAHIVADAKPTLMVCRPGGETILRESDAGAAVGQVLTLGSQDDGTFAEASRACDNNFPTESRIADDVAALLYTSGTTGLPKGVMLTHGNLASNAITLHREWGWRENDVLLHALPLFHTHGLFVACHCALMGGTSMIFLPKFDLDQILAGLNRASVFMGVPTFYTRLLNESRFDAEVCKNMRLFVSGSAPLLEQTFQDFENRTGHSILERYGMTETGMNTSNPLEGKRKPGTIGHPLPDVEIRIVKEDGDCVTGEEIGQLQVKGPNVFRGYWRQPEKTAEEFSDDGYFCTGDLGCYDEDGYIVLVGRSKDLVISGGYNVYPKEVELLIDELVGVKESAIIGLSDPDLGEAVTAVVILQQGQQNLTAEALIGQLKAVLAGYKVPKSVVFMDELPRNAMGKVQKNVLREMLSPKLPETSTPNRD